MPTFSDKDMREASKYLRLQARIGRKRENIMTSLENRDWDTFIREVAHNIPRILRHKVLKSILKLH
jgi:hypothetical protein